MNTIYSKWFENFESPFASTQKEESELGNIPLGWKVAELGEFIESYSKTHQFNKDKLIFLNTSDILSGVFLNNAYMQVADMPGQAKRKFVRVTFYSAKFVLQIKDMPLLLFLPTIMSYRQSSWCYEQHKIAYPI